MFICFFKQDLFFLSHNSTHSTYRRQRVPANFYTVPRKTSKGDEVQHTTSSSLLQLGIALWLRSFRIFPYAQRDGTREVRHKHGNRRVCSGDCFQPFQVQRLKFDARSHPVPRSSCSENSRVVKLFLKEDESVYLSQFLSQSSWQCLASFWWEKIKAVNKGRVSINKLQEKN